MIDLLLIHHAGSLGGGGVGFLHLVRSLEPLDVRVTVYCPDTPPTMRRWIQHECPACTLVTGPTLTRLPHYSGEEYLLFDPRFTRAMWEIYRDKSRVIKLISDHRPDIVAVNSMTLAWIGPLAKRLGKRTVCFCRETLTYGSLGLRTALLKHCLQHEFDTTVFISHFDARAMGLPKSKACVLPDAVDFTLYDTMSQQEAREHLGLDPTAFYLLYLGGLNPIKGGELLLQALATSLDPRVHLLFVGDIHTKNSRLNLKDIARRLMGIDYERRISRKLSDPRFRQRLHLLTPTSNVAILYAAADVVVFPSTKPHQARPIYEAGAARRPCVVSNFPHTSEFLQHEYNGLTFTPGDPTSLGQTINRLLNDPMLAQKLADNHYQCVKSQHDLGLVPQRLGDILDLDFKHH